MWRVASTFINSGVTDENGTPSQNPRDLMDMQLILLIALYVCFQSNIVCCIKSSSPSWLKPMIEFSLWTTPCCCKFRMPYVPNKSFSSNSPAFHPMSYSLICCSKGGKKHLSCYLIHTTIPSCVRASFVCATVMTISRRY